MRAYAEALQPPAGPVYLSIPMDDWKRPLSGFARVRTVSDRVVPDTERLRGFADRISASLRPALVFGPEVDRSGGWDAAVALAEKLRASVYGAPLLDRASFPENHPLFRGPLGMSVKTISDRLTGHDLVVVIGAEVFRYYPYVPGDYLPEGTELLQITGNPGVAAAARVGDSLLGDPTTAIELLLDMVTEGSARTAPEPMARPRELPQAPNSPDRRHHHGHRGAHATPRRRCCSHAVRTIGEGAAVMDLGLKDRVYIVTGGTRGLKGRRARAGGGWREGGRQRTQREVSGRR